MITHDGGTVYRCPICGATYVAHDQSFDGWRCDHSPTFPRPAHRWGELHLSAAYDPAAFPTRGERNPVIERIGTLADYLGVGTGQLAAYTVTDHSTGESYARFYWWQPPTA